MKIFLKIPDEDLHTQSESESESDLGFGNDEDDDDESQGSSEFPGNFSSIRSSIVCDYNDDEDDYLRKIRGLSCANPGELSSKKKSEVDSTNNNKSEKSRVDVPSLENLCLNILLNNFESIETLEIVPEELKDRLCEMYCDTRGIDIRFLRLLVGKTPDIVRVKDCSWMTEEEMTECFRECELNRLRVLQLDLCARCLSDNILRTTLARSPGCMPALVTISLKGGYRISDVGLSLLVAAAPFLRSINLSECSLITFTGIDIIADSLGLNLRELYLDYCEAVDLDVMRILPAMKKLLYLEVLSLRGLQTVCDDFVTGVVAESGTNMKELVLASCVKLTDRCIKVIAKICSGLYALDISDLPQLTDLSIRYNANGCSMIQNLELRRNAFSDVAIAALLEIRGESLKVLSLCKNVGPNTTISLARCCIRNLVILDLSFCRKLTEEALGHIIDSCLSLRLLKVFGCAQITRVLVDGHSNPLVNIIGLQFTMIIMRFTITQSLPHKN